MFKFLLVLFSFIVLLLLAGQWAIHSNVQQWRDGAFAAFVLSFIIDGIVTEVGSRTRRTTTTTTE